MCALPLRFIKERNKVSTASAYCLEQWRTWLIVHGISRQDRKRKQRQSDRKKKAEAERE